MSTKASKVKTPDDPDPTPTYSAATAEDKKSESRAEQKRVAKSYGRQSSILASSGEKKNILGS